MIAAGASKFARIDGLTVGQATSLKVEVTGALVDAFAQLSGDDNPLHMSDSFAQSAGFGSRVAHGALLAAYVSNLIGTKLPGPGCLWLKQQFQWRVPVLVGETVEITTRVKHISLGTNIVLLTVQACNQQGAVVMDGEGAVALPKETPLD